MTGGATFYLKPGSSASSSYSALTVYGNETNARSFNVNNGGSVAIAGSNVGSFNLNGGGGISIGGSNGGTINTSNGGAITIGGGNTGNLSASGSSVFVGGGNNANININGTGSASVIGANSGTISVGSGSIYAGSNSGNVSVNGNGSISLNGSNTNQLTLNGSGTVKIAGDTGNININGGSINYTGNKTGNVNANGGAQTTKVSDAGVTTPTAPTTTLPSFTSTFVAPLTALSSQLDSLTANSQVKVSGNSITFDAAPDASHEAVFDIDSSIFTANSTVSFSLNGATTVIINVNVDSCVSTVCAFSFANSINFINPTGYADKVLWNFVNATGITFSNEFGGTVLAVNAAVSNNNPIDGTLVAASYNGNGEIHEYAFTGTLPSSTPVAAPEPGSLALMATGFLGLGIARRKWRSRR